jgi:beta-lactam-binding protein with PASTA domain
VAETVRQYLPRDWVFPIVLAIFVAALVWFGRSIHDFLLPPSDTVTVPSFVGQTLTDANAEVERLKLTGAVIDHTTSDRYPKNVVIMQRPDAGTAVREGRQISFVISDGIIARLMPDLRYQSMREVNLDLSRSKLQLGKVTYVKSDVIPDGHVISQDPSPLSSVVEGDTVNLTVSRGGASQLHVPNFVGMNVDAARALADKDGIKLGQLVWTPLGRNGPAHGQVTLQMPKAGTKVAAYDQVSLQVSSGPYESGYIIRQARLLVSVPVPENVPNGKQLEVRLAMTDATGKYDLYHAFAEPGQKLDLTVTAIGTSVVDMYVNDVLVGETRLGAEPAAIYDMKPSPSPSPGAP